MVIGRNAHARLSAAVSAPEAMVAEHLTEVLREIASQAVHEFERRTGQQFLWIDEPDPAEDPNNALMEFRLDDKGNVTL